MQYCRERMGWGHSILHSGTRANLLMPAVRQSEWMGGAVKAGAG